MEVIEDGLECRELYRVDRLAVEAARDACGSASPVSGNKVFAISKCLIDNSSFSSRAQVMLINQVSRSARALLGSSVF